MEKELTTMNVGIKNREWLNKMKFKLRLRAYDDVLSKIIKLIRYNKMEEELK
jgi:hypothetical protein|tara:strand:+ start:2735 stop:2890 length:156 start_codon:yes stop_codon:yes gene_type:complete